MEKADFVIAHFLEAMAMMGIPVEIKTILQHVSKKMKQTAYYNLKHITRIPQNPTWQAVIERSYQTLKDMLNKQKRVIKAPEINCIMLY